MATTPNRSPSTTTDRSAFGISHLTVVPCNHAREDDEEGVTLPVEES